MRSLVKVRRTLHPKNDLSKYNQLANALGLCIGKDRFTNESFPRKTVFTLIKDFVRPDTAVENRHKLVLSITGNLEGDAKAAVKQDNDVSGGDGYFTFQSNHAPIESC